MFVDRILAIIAMVTALVSIALGVASICLRLGLI